MVLTEKQQKPCTTSKANRWSQRRNKTGKDILMMTIIIIAVLCVFVFILMLNRGADNRRTNSYTRERDDEAQEKALKQMMEERKAKK